jgi:hypothetical protein
LWPARNSPAAAWWPREARDEWAVSWHASGASESFWRGVAAAARWPGEVQRRGGPERRSGDPALLASRRSPGGIEVGFRGYGLDGGKNRKAVSGEDVDANSTVQHGDDGDDVVRGHRNDRDGGARHGEEQTRRRGDSERWGRRGGEAASA